MSSIEIIAIIVAGALGGGTVPFLWRRYRNGDPQQPQTDALAALADEIRDLKTTSREPEAPPASTRERLDELERRMEQVHSDCLRYLQKAAASEQRANQRRAAQEEEEGLSEEEARNLLAQEQQSSDHPSGQLSLEELEDWGARGE